MGCLNIVQGLGFRALDEGLRPSGELSPFCPSTCTSFIKTKLQRRQFRVSCHAILLLPVESRKFAQVTRANIQTGMLRLRCVTGFRVVVVEAGQQQLH